MTHTFIQSRPAIRAGLQSRRGTSRHLLSWRLPEIRIHATSNKIRAINRARPRALYSSTTSRIIVRSVPHTERIETHRARANFAGPRKMCSRRLAKTTAARGSAASSYRRSRATNANWLNCLMASCCSTSANSPVHTAGARGAATAGAHGQGRRRRPRPAFVDRPERSEASQSGRTRKL